MFVVPDLFDEGYLTSLVHLNKDAHFHVSECYGAISHDLFVGNIRHPETVPKFFLKELEPHINALHANGFRFNYVANSILDNVRANCRNFDIVKVFLERLLGAGVDAITLSIPYYIEYIRKQFPEICIVVSVCSRIDNVSVLERYADLGINRVVFPKELNRSPKALSKLVAYCKKLNIQTELLCNSPCLLSCPSEIVHAAATSSLYHKSPIKACPCVDFCWSIRVSQPCEWIKQPIIRPEDIRSFVDMGIDLFKLDGRNQRKAYMLRVIRAYLGEKWKGNLLFLTSPFYAKTLREFRILVKRGWNKKYVPVYLESSDMNWLAELVRTGCIDCRDGCAACKLCSEHAKSLIIDQHGWKKFAARKHNVYSNHFVR